MRVLLNKTSGRESTQFGSVTGRGPTSVEEINQSRRSTNPNTHPREFRNWVGETIEYPCGRTAYLVFLTYSMAFFNLTCFAKSLATVASLVWNVRRALMYDSVMNQ